MSKKPSLFYKATMLWYAEEVLSISMSKYDMKFGQDFLDIQYMKMDKTSWTNGLH